MCVAVAVREAMLICGGRQRRRLAKRENPVDGLAVLGSCLRLIGFVTRLTGRGIVTVGTRWVAIPFGNETTSG